MKPFIPYSLLAAAALCGVALGQSATTDPVGYITQSINGNVGANPSGAATYISATLIEATEFASASSVSPSGSATVTFAGGVPVDLDDSFVLEIRAGDQEGWWSTVISSTANSITVNDTFPNGLPESVSVSVRKHSTLQSLLGSNSPGLKPISNSNEPPYDSVELLDPVTQATTVAVYVLEEVGVPQSGWYDFVTQDQLDGAVIHPGTSVKIVRHDESALELVSSGTVKVTKTQVDVYPNFNWLGQPIAVGATLGSMNFYDQIIKFDNGVTENDFISLLNPDQSSDVFVAADPSLGIGSIMANFVTADDATNIAVPDGYVFQRAASQAASVITIPAQVVAP
jgi:hypothetical protein